MEKIPEEQKQYITTMKDMLTAKDNDIANKDLVINTLKTNKPKPKEELKPKEEELDDTDPYASSFKKLNDRLDAMDANATGNQEKNWKNNLVAFAQKTPDIAKYVKDMDVLMEEHPTLRNDVPTLYTMAKTVAERRNTKLEEKKKDLNIVKDAKRFSTETDSSARQTVTTGGNAKSIAEAFEIAEKEK